MLLPIRFSGAEVRRPEGVTLRKLASERHPDTTPGLRIFEEAKVRIGAEARRLANAALAAQADSEAHVGSPSARDTGDRQRMTSSTLRSSSAPTPPREESTLLADRHTPSLEGSEFDTASYDSAPYDLAAHEALGAAVPYETLRRAVSVQDWSGDSEPLVELPILSATGEESRVSVFTMDNERPGLEHGETEAAKASETTSVPYDVLRRVVTNAASEAASGAPAEPLFSAPENGGEPYGREVPFVDEEAPRSQLFEAPGDTATFGENTSDLE